MRQKSDFGLCQVCGKSMEPQGTGVCDISVILG